MTNGGPGGEEVMGHQGLAVSFPLLLALTLLLGVGVGPELIRRRPEPPLDVVVHGHSSTTSPSQDRINR
jgi:hypothetical protein